MRNLQLSPGTLFANRFEIVRTAGSGGMGTVYRATDRRSGETVALKLLHAEAGSSNSAARFLAEAQLLSELRHPGIVAYVANGQTLDGQRFLAMEWLEGEDLGERLLRGPLPIRDCLRLLDQVADALSIAHQSGVIHRDLKPTNLFLVGGDVGRVKILDFGIARRVAASQVMTRTGMVVGTPEYMAPEQAHGSRELTPAADMFSIGCVLYECLTGQPPFVADHIAAVLVRILFEDAIPVEERRPGVPPALSALLERLLVKDPAQRLADAAALRAALKGLNELPEPALAVPMASPKPKAETFAEQEQSLFSVVLAVSSEEETEPGETQSGSAAQTGAAGRQALLQALTALGGSPDFLANGTLVVTVPSLGSAQDQATLAARAALLIKERLPEAVVSMATGRGAARGRMAVGEVVERAARSLNRGSHPALGKPTTGVLIDSLSAKLLEGRFAQTPQPDGAVLLHEQRDADASRPLLGKPTPCVGRETELATLDVQLSDCIEESEARAVLITAPPGVGKSRLRHEFLRRVEKRSEPITVLLGRGDVMSAGAPYGILRAALHKLCGISGSEPLDMQRERLRARVARHLAAADADRVVLFVGELCNVPFPTEGKPMLQAARQEPKLMRDGLRRALLDFLAAECTAAPVLLVLDDLQWADELTVSILEETLRVQAGAPLFVLSFARPEVHKIFPKLWHGCKVQELPLNGLSKKACERLIVQMLGKDVAPDKIARAVEQAGGNAFFLEELIRSLAEGKESDYPETAVAMLQARIDRLDARVRRTIRAAAVFGQTFWEAGIQAVLEEPKGSPETTECLATLVDAELILPHATSQLANESEYRFRHSLIREAAYSLLSEADLRTGHRRAGEFLVRTGQNDPVQIAEHFSRGNSKNLALKFTVLAAAQYYEHFDIDNALHYIEKGEKLDAEGEELGKLLAIKSQALFHRNDFMNGAMCGYQSFQLLAPRSNWWYRLIGPFITLTNYTRQTELQAQAIDMLVSSRPEPDTLIPYANAAKETMFGTLAMLGLRAAAEALLFNMEKYGDHSLLYKSIYDITVSAYELYLGRRPWRQRQAAYNAAVFFSEIGEKYNCFWSLQCQVYGESDFGAWEVCAQTCQQLLEVTKQIGDPLLIETSRLYLANYLTMWPEKRDSDEALATTLGILNGALQNPMVVGVAEAFLSRVFHARKDFVESEKAARRARASLLGYTSLHRMATGWLVQALHAQGASAEAVLLANDLLAQLGSFGPAGRLEVPLRLAASEALQGAGDRERARTELGETLRQIQLRADDIADSFWRSSYLTRNPDCVRAQELGRKWGLDIQVM